MDKVRVNIVNGYGNFITYTVKNECPKCKENLKITGVNNECRDGEFGQTDKITCENDCFFTYQELKKYNNILD